MSTSSTLTMPRQNMAKDGGGLLLSIPWYLYVVLLSSTSIVIGLIWDVSWHISIGRDTLWSPPHLATYLGGVGAGFATAYQVFRITFWGTPAEKENAVTIWGFKGPLGGWFCVWGAIAMLTSAPFDDWWHNTYGLDVKILSPPHVVLLLGMTTIQLGALITIVPQQNLSLQSAAPWAGRKLRRLGLMYTYAAGILIAMMGVTFDSYIYNNIQHSTIFYKVSCLVFPLFLVSASRASNMRWAATTAALFYMLIVLELNWILQLFPAEPKLAPIRNPITHMVPMGFPLLLVFPALALDLVRMKWGHLKDMWQSVLMAAAFLAVLLPVQWFFSIFLLSPYSRNFVFMGNAMAYYGNPNSSWRFVFHEEVTSADELLAGLAIALVFGILSSRVGLYWGNWMRRVKR